MKKFITLTLAIVFIGTTAFADTNNKASYSSTTNFYAQHSDASDISWSSDGKFDKASYMENGVKSEAFYTTDGELVGISKNFAFDKLPKSALQTITTKFTYPSFSLENCIAFENTDGDTTYFISMNGEKENLILEVSQYGAVSVFSREKK
jgi:hypothetical protein